MKGVLTKSLWIATGLLLIPVLGEQFVEGWNWSWHDFVFAWGFWVVMSLAIILVAQKSGRYKLIVGAAVFLCFATVWVMLATG